MTLLRFIGCFTLAVGLQGQSPVEKSWAVLMGACGNKDHETRAKGVHALGLVPGNARAQSLAEVALKDEREEVRAAAADTLGTMRAKSAIPKLKAMINDSAASVVFAATNALFVMGDPGAYEVYYAVVTGERKSGDALVDSQMKMLKDPQALTRLGFEAGIGFIPFGGVGYKVARMAMADAATPVRAAAVSKLTHDPDARSAKALERATKDEKWLVRAAAAGAIARRGNPSLAPALTPLLDDENEVARFNAAAAVIHLSSRAPQRAKPAARKK